MVDLNFFYQYISSEKISLNKDEFEYQFNSHPDYPSLLALSDTLSFFNIANGAFKIDSSEIDLLPDRFLAQLEKHDNNVLSYVEKKENLFFRTDEKERKAISKRELESLWSGVVVLLEETGANSLEKRPRSSMEFLLGIFSITTFLIILIIEQFSITTLICYIFSIVGIWLSVTGLKDIFGFKNSLIDKFCQESSHISCNSILSSKKWKVLEIINFSDLAIIFFAAQFSYLTFMSLTNRIVEFFLVQKFLLFLSVPLLITSIYYQKFIEKKWCPICLMIIGLLVVELLYVINYDVTIINSADITKEILLFLNIGFFTSYSWFKLKNILVQKNYLRAEKLKANRFKRNYKLFKKVLETSRRYKLPENKLTFGTPSAGLNIAIVTSPYCDYCKSPHYMLKSFLEKFQESISVSIYYNVSSANDNLRKFAKNVTGYTLENTDSKYFEAVDFWYEVNDLEKWLNKYNSLYNSEEIGNLIKKQNTWFRQNDINFTPFLFINGYRYPEHYDIEDLQFFIEELINDNTFSKKELETEIAETEKL
ncbi:hypothetical protein E0K83_12300 [Gramella sp. BOM4]|nr:hypothetical protein [Christiangramia bathymodioli]